MHHSLHVWRTEQDFGCLPLLFWSRLYCLETGLLTEPELSAMLAGQHTLRSHLQLVTGRCIALPAFYTVAGDLNSWMAFSGRALPWYALDPESDLQYYKSAFLNCLLYLLCMEYCPHAGVCAHSTHRKSKDGSRSPRPKLTNSC